MAGMRQKHPDTLINKWGGRYKPLQVVEAGSAPLIPSLSRSHLPETRRIWRDLWRSRLAGAYQETDIPGLRRWAWYFDQWLRVTRAVRTPADRRFLRFCESAMRDLEKAFGLDVLSRMRLGLTILEGQSAVAKLKAPTTPQPMKGDT